MKKKIRKRFIFLNLFLLICFLSSLVFILFSAREYTEIRTVNYFPENYPTNVTYEIDNDHVEITDIQLTQDTVIVKVKPLSIGRSNIDLTVTLNGLDEPVGEYLQLCTAPFGTIFSLNPYVDFNGSQYVIYLVILCLGIVMTLMIISFFDYLKKSDFGYPMVACGGVGLFCLVYFLINLILPVVYGDAPFFFNYSISFGGYFFQLIASSEQFVLFTAPFMLIFSMALTISNIELIHREGFRFVNILGILFGVLWIAGFILNMVFDQNASGSMLHGAIFTSLSYAIATVICYFECMLFSTIVSASLASRHKPPYDRDYIAILGCAIRKDGTLTPLLKGRVDAAIAFAKEQKEKTGKAVRFVPSGGKGSDEIISEGEAMTRYLIEQGIPKEQILPETESKNTFENVKFSRDIIEADTKGDYNAAFATTNYHVFRGYILSKKNNLKNAQGISAKTKWYFFPNAFLREVVGLVVDKKKTHLLLIVILTLCFVLFNIVYFL